MRINKERKMIINGYACVAVINVGPGRCDFSIKSADGRNLWEMGLDCPLEPIWDAVKGLMDEADGSYRIVNDSRVYVISEREYNDIVSIRRFYSVAA